MNIRQGAWHIAKHELSRDWLGIVFTVLFSLYLAFITIAVYNDTEQTTSWLLDLLFMVAFPSLAFVMNKTTLHFWREDNFTGKLAEWRTLPIPLSHLVIGRMIQLVIVLTLVLTIFFTIQYVLVDRLHEHLSVGAYLLYVVFWYFYALSMAVLYAYFEIGHSGKTYAVFCFIYVAVFVLICVGFGLTHVGIVDGLLDEAEKGHWWYSAAALVVCILTMYTGYWIIKRRLKQRHYTKKMPVSS
ncbi:hypothetical protein [Paenibacillus glycanilyticus]|uniref:ABC transporter permease n=1 Tax=Paenibacillus glycanilyticus TaxID=126569 RepID=A0ABQ6GGY5_9BACL|nr:hypothetical protein [Paenibacillus glycanilyticus]GLX68882.1 hypothetical protein MU1_32270 [Paenibacillus glycanilyticus]